MRVEPFHLNQIRNALDQIDTTGLTKLSNHLSHDKPILLTGGISTRNHFEATTVY